MVRQARRRAPLNSSKWSLLTGPSSWSQAKRSPGPVTQFIANAVVQPAGLALPELYHFGHNTKAAPVGWTWDFLALIGLFKAMLTRLNPLPVRYDHALGRYPGTQLAGTWPAVEVGI